MVIARQLTEAGVPTGQYGSVWNESRLHRMLTNEVYLGMIRDGHDKQVKVLENGEIRIKRLIQKDYTLVPGLHPAIIDRDLFDACARKLHTPHPRGSAQRPGFNATQGIPQNDGKHRANPMAGLLFCSECGRVIRRKAACGRQRDRLFCHTPGCPTVATYYDEVELSVLNTLQDWLHEADMQRESDAVPLPSYAQTRLLNLQKERDAVSGQLDKLYDLLERGLYSEELFTARHIALNRRLKELDAQIADANADLKTEYVPLSQLRDDIQTLLHAYNGADASSKNRMLKNCISKIVYHKSERGNIINGRVVADDKQFKLDVFPRLLNWKP